MKHRIRAATVALAILVGAPFSAFAAGPQSGTTSSPHPEATARLPNGHTDPDLAKMIGIEPSYVFPDNTPTRARSPKRTQH